MTKDEKKGVLIVGSILSIGVFVFVGFDVKQYKIDSCESTISKYVTAEYSETSLEIDYEGKTYMDTDYWSEQASAVNGVSFINEVPVYPEMPAHDLSMSKGRNFDRFKYHTDTNLTISASNLLDNVTFKEPIGQAAQCIKSLNEFADIKTWWTIAYSSDFKVSS